MNRMVNGEPCGAGLIPDRRNTEKREHSTHSGNKKWSKLVEAKGICRRVMGEKAEKNQQVPNCEKPWMPR